MKKISIFILPFFIFCSNLNAKVIEFEKCFRTTNWWDYTKIGTEQEFPSPTEVKWTEENFIRATSYISVKKEDLLNNVNKLPISKKYLDKKINKYPRLDQVTFTASQYTKEDIEAFLSIGGKLKPYLEKHVYSLNTNNGILTELKIEHSDWFNHKIALTEEDLSGNSQTVVNDKETLRDLLNELKKRGRVSTKKFQVTTYAGDTLIVKNQREEYIFDLKSGILNKRFVSKGDVNTFTSDTVYKCPDNMSTNNDGENKGSSGTAFFVSNKGHLLTNNHVVDGCDVSKITYKDKDYNTRLLATDKTLDLALLKADLRNKSYLNFSGDEAKKMQKIYVGGYPLGKGLSDDLKISSGIVSSLKGFEDNSNEIQIDAAINPGNSGGPIINEDGELVAIAVSGMSKDKTEGINFGIKASAAERFLKSNDLKASSSFFSSSKDNDELLEILEEATVYTYCN